MFRFSSLGQYSFFWRWFWITQFCVLLAVYTYLGLTPHPEKTLAVTYNDKVMHFIGYVIAAFSLSFAAPRTPVWQRGIFLIVYSIAIEIGQHFMPPRTFSLLDIVANSGGVILGLCLVVLLKITTIISAHPPSPPSDR